MKDRVAFPAKDASSLKSINELEFGSNLDAIDDGELRKLARKNYSIWSGDNNYWRPKFQEARKNFDHLDGKSFEDWELADFESRGIDPIEIPLILPKLMGLSGHQRATGKDGMIVPTGGEDAPSASDMTKIVKMVRHQNHLDQEKSLTFFEGIVGGVPNFVWFERVNDPQDPKKMRVWHELWDATLLDPDCRRQDLSDCNRITRVRRMNIDQICRTWPNRAKHIMDNLGKSYWNEFANMAGRSPDNRDMGFVDNAGSYSEYERTGLITVIERLFFAVQKARVIISEDGSDVLEIPEDWDDNQFYEFMKQNPDYHVGERDMRRLWVTTSTTLGHVIENAPHWYQVNRMPCSVFWVAWDGKMRSWVTPMVASQKMNSIGRTMYTNSLKNDFDHQVIAREGFFVDPELAKREKGTPGGMMIAAADADLHNDFLELKPAGGNQGFADLSAIAHDDLDNISNINPAMLGQQESANEANVRMERRITQGQVSQAFWFDCLEIFDIELHRTMLKMIPLCYSRWETIQVLGDDEEEVESIEVNKPEGIDPSTMGPAKIINNMATAEYDYMIGKSDNSLLAQQMEEAEYLEFVRNIQQSMPEDQLIDYCMGTSNRKIRDYGKRLQKRIEERSKQAEDGTLPPGREDLRLNLNIGAEDILTRDPIILGIMRRKGMITREEYEAGIKERPMSQGQVKEGMEKIANQGTEKEAQAMSKAAGAQQNPAKKQPTPLKNG